MKIQKRKKYLSAFFMLGFLIGILYANVIAKQYIAEAGVFSEYFLSQYLRIDVAAKEYMAYIFPIRVFPMALLFLIGQTKYRRLGVASWVIWLGFSSGMLVVTGIMQLGVKGVLLCLMGVFPQFIFYIMAYLVILWYFYAYPEILWNKGKTIFVTLTMSLGIILESYVNPILMKMFINAM